LVTLQEVAEELARRMEAQVQPSGESPQEIMVEGKGYHFIVAPFFGGWQATLYLPDRPPSPFYGEALEMLELRMKAKLSGRQANF
jgi:hypothetical protein